jgi:hypothetical protein
MKKITFLTITLLLLGLGNAYSQKSKKLEGGWKMVYSKWELPDTVVEHSQFDKPSYKIFTGKFFTLSRLDENDEFIGHFGKYSYDGETYVEHIEYSSYEYVIGRTETFRSTIKGNIWTIEGKIGKEGEGFKLKEEWERIE